MNQIKSQLFDKTLEKLNQKDRESCISARNFKLLLGIANMGFLPLSYKITMDDYIKAYCLVHGYFLADFPDGTKGYMLEETGNEIIKGIVNDRIIVVKIKD